MKTKINEELIGAFLEGNTTPEESATILRMACEDKGLRSLIDKSVMLDDMKSEESQCVFMAAQTCECGNRCEVVCERSVMGKFGIERSVEELVSRAEERDWLDDEGMPIENMGCLMESEGLRVKRSFHNGIEELRRSIADGCGVIAMVDAAETCGGCNDDEMGYTPNHAVLVTEVSDGEVVFFDPERDEVRRLGHVAFMEAWNDSSGYMVTGNMVKK